MQFQLVRTIPALVWMLAIFVMSSRSQVPQPPGLSIQLVAIAGHFAAYGLLAILVAFAVPQCVRQFASRAAVAFIVTVLYGVSDELHQSFVSGRHASVGDVVVDALGALTGIGVLYFVTRWRNERLTT